MGNNQVENGMSMMKYAVNHHWKFEYTLLAFGAGLLQVISCIFIAMVNYAVIIQSQDINDLSKDFTALMVIAYFDDIFCRSISRESLIRTIIISKDYKDLFKIETTTSEEAKGDQNVDIDEDRVSRIVRRRIDKENKR